MSKLTDVLRGDLTDKERKVLDMRFGLDASTGEVGESFRVTRERIREIEEKALRKLRARADRPSMDDVLNEDQ